MDRRKRKSREAIVSAFADLLSRKQFSEITVGEIIERADVGRATFYAHFETKDFLLKALCEELFCHVFDSTRALTHPHDPAAECDAQDSVFLHLFRHLCKNDNHLLDLLAGQNNDIFLHYFRKGLIDLIDGCLGDIGIAANEGVPRPFLVNHVAATFVEAVRWWVENKMQETPEEITRYFMLAIHADNALAAGA